jgi:beta-lactamase regulating signal transducer with metallopeptidase domain/DUF4097 and DUF4098 domain-containing protein YvlB
MMATIIDAALRSLLLAILVWAGLRIFRVRNVLAEKAAWAAVLAAALLMPAALPLSARWQFFPSGTLVIPTTFARARSAFHEDRQPASATLVSDDGATRVLAVPDAPAAHRLELASPDQPSAPAISASKRSSAASALQQLRKIQPAAWVTFAIGLYLVIAAGFLIRLIYGLVSILRLWHGATPAVFGPTLPGNAFRRHVDLKVRFSRNVLSPITVGSGVLLPEDYAEWDQEKLRVVLAHERAHIFHRDFYWQLLASLYAALVWFSPLGWWLKRKLSDLGEAISDHAGLEEARNRSAYARILLEFAATPHPNFIGVAMARKSNISRRIERLLNDRVFRQTFAGSRRSRVALILAPFALFAFTALIHVQAATQPLEQTAASSVVNQISQQAGTISKSTPTQAPVFFETAKPAGGPATSPAARELVAAIDPLALIPAPAAATAAAMAAPAQEAASAAAPSQAEATFDRTLTINGKLALLVSTASGNIHLTHGSANQVQIHGRVRSNQAEESAQVHDIAANPPIEQDGNTIRIGKQHEQGTHHFSIDYEIIAPADATLDAATGSGNITDEGVGQGASLMTGSGNISATGLQGGFKAQTGSGNIAIAEAGEGDAKAQTGSGSIDVKGVHGSLKAQTGSGDIKANGTPSAEWKLQTGSGSIELSTGNAPIDLDASAGSGSISTTAATMKTSADKHHMHVQLNGGGPAVKIETGSGSIRIQ